MTMFNFNTLCQIVLKNGPTKCSAKGVPMTYLFPLFQHPILSDFKKFANIMDMKVVSNYFNLCFSISEVEVFFICLLAFVLLL